MHARTGAADPTPAGTVTWSEPILYAHHFWLASSDFGLDPVSAANPHALKLVSNQVRKFGSDQALTFASAPVDRRSKHGLFPSVGEPAWHKAETLDDSETLCWAYQIDDVTATVAAVRAQSASESWFEEARQLIVTADAHPTLLGSCDCRVIRATSVANLRRLLEATFGTGFSPSRSVIALTSDRAMTLYQGCPAGSDRIILLAILPAEDDADEKASDMLNRVIPDFARLLLKIAIVSHNWETNLRPNMIGVEQKLVPTDLPRGRRALEKELKHLVHVHHGMAQNVALLQHQSQSASTNLVNLESLRSGLSVAETGWFEEGLVSARMTTEQLKRDLRYFIARLDETEVRISTCRIGSDLERIRIEQIETVAWNRRTQLIALIGLVLAALQILDERTTMAIFRAMTGYPEAMTIGPIEALAVKFGLILSMVVATAVIIPKSWKLMKILWRMLIGGGTNGQASPR